MKVTRMGVLAVAMLALLASAGLAGAQQGAIYADLATAIKESGLDTTKVLRFDPIAFEDGVATYQLWQHGRDDQVLQVLVATAIDPTRPDPEEPRSAERGVALKQAPSPDVAAPLTKILTHPSSGRCSISLYRNVNFNGGTITTNLDWNAYPKFANQTNFNDHVTSLRTGCHAILIYPHKNLGGGGLFFPANTSIPDLSVYSFNDKASSHFIYCY